MDIVNSFSDLKVISSARSVRLLHLSVVEQFAEGVVLVLYCTVGLLSCGTILVSSRSLPVQH
jgi:hypothetical protein